MNKSNYDARRPMFWSVTVIAVLVVVHAVVTFLRSGFSHPVSSVTDIMVKSGIWIMYSTIIRELRVARGQIADALAIRVEVATALCCIMGYTLAIPAMK